jgi:hypothetical protein
MTLNNSQKESLKNKICEVFPHEQLPFQDIYEKTQNGIGITVLVRGNEKIKTIYVIVTLKIDEQFNRLDELKIITESICETVNADFAYFSTCNFIEDMATDMPADKYQIERNR